MKRNPRLEEIRRIIPLEISLRVSLQMDDYDNWRDGEYLGDMNKINNIVEIVLKDVEDWYNNTDRIIYAKNSRYKH